MPLYICSSPGRKGAFVEEVRPDWAARIYANSLPSRVSGAVVLVVPADSPRSLRWFRLQWKEVDVEPFDEN